MTLVANPFLPVRSVKELVALERSRPGDLVYASRRYRQSDPLAE